MQATSAASAAAASAGNPSSRLFYLDAVRAFAMFFGIFAHGSTIANPYINEMTFFFVLQNYNNLFRAATFFLVSGFFTALVYRKNDFRTYAKGRFDVIIIPLISSMILIVPITNWMIHTWHNGPMSLTEYFTGGWRNPTVGTDTWALHIWFLYSLAIYAILAPFIAKLIDSDWFSKGLNFYLDKTAGFTIWTNVIIFAIAIMAGRGAYDKVFRYVFDDTMFHWIVRASLIHLPMFFLGMVAFTNRRFLSSISTLNVFGIVLFIGLRWAVQTYGDLLPRDLMKVLYWTAQGGLSVFVISSIIWFFQKFANKPSKFLSFAVDSAYSFYIFHMTFIYIVAWFAVLFTKNLYLIYLMIVILGAPLTLAWHAYVINRSETLRFMFTGKRQPRVEIQPTTTSPST